jgi:hypothetical protein
MAASSSRTWAPPCRATATTPFSATCSSNRSLALHARGSPRRACLPPASRSSC